MKYGFIKVGAASPRIIPADINGNAESIIAAVKAADKAGINLLVLPELCITGATCGDMFFHSLLTDRAYEALEKIAAETAKCAVISIIGLPVRKNGKLYNCCAVVSAGRILAVVPKNKSDRHFSAGNDNFIFSCREYPSFTFSLSRGKGAAVIAEPYAECELAGSAKMRRMKAMAFSDEEICTYIRAGAGMSESTTDMVFGGHCIIAEKGDILAESIMNDGSIAAADTDIGALAFMRAKSGFECDCGAEVIEFSLEVKDIKPGRTFRKLSFVPETGVSERCAEIFGIQCRALEKRLSAIGCNKTVIGVSGGLDSTLAVLAAVKTNELLGGSRENVITVTMPCFGTSSRTKSNAEKLCELLGTDFRTVDITKSVRQHFEDIGHSENDCNVTFENAQARERTQVLMDIANENNAIVIGTGDLSELALGWATYNGDHMAMYGVNASIPKTLIRAMVRWYAAECGNPALAEVLNDIAETPVSPELIPSENGEIAQKTEDIVGPYELHDFFLYHLLARGSSPEKILMLAEKSFDGEYDSDTIRKWLRKFLSRFFSQQYKRSCLPDGPKTGTVSLSPRGDFMMPSDICGKEWMI